VQSLSSAGISDVEPDSHSNWNTLTAAQTASGIAFGVQPTGTWAVINRTSPLYAADVSSPVKLGTLAAGATGDISLSAKYGLAWSSGKTVSQSMTLLFTACDVS
jgi:hypothetical protein